MAIELISVIDRFVFVLG